MKDRFFFFLIALFCGGWLNPTHSSAQITVTDVIYYFRADSRPVHNVTVKNSSNETMYVTVEPSEILRAGFEDEQRLDTKDIIAAPRRFSIPGLGQRTVRLLLRSTSREEEKVYRVKFVPAAQPFDFSENKKHKKQLALQVLTGVGMLIFAEPIDPQVKLIWQRTGNEVHFRNEGSVNVLLTSPRACAATAAPGTGINEDESCSPIAAHLPRLYPGNETILKAPADKTVVLTQHARDEQSKIVISPSR